jgi:hypothetical protein
MASAAKPSSGAAGRSAAGYSAVIASDSEATQAKPQTRSPSLDCFALLAMTDSVVDDHASKSGRFYAGPSR